MGISPLEYVDYLTAACVGGGRAVHKGGCPPVPRTAAGDSAELSRLDAELAAEDAKLVRGAAGRLIKRQQKQDMREAMEAERDTDRRMRLKYQLGDVSADEYEAFLRRRIA